MSTDDTRTLIFYLNALLDDQKTPLPAKYANNPDLLSLIQKIERIQLESARLSDTEKRSPPNNCLQIENLLSEEYKRASRCDQPFAVVFIDIDHFPWVNDRFGQSAGDLLLNELSEVLLDNIRQTDRIERRGDEVFLIILPDTDAEGAMLFAEKIRLKITRHEFTRPAHITVSLGVAVYQGCGTLQSLIDRADEALNAARKAGRNQVQQG